MNKREKSELFELTDAFFEPDAENAKQYIGQSCYFGNDIEQLERSITHKSIGIFAGIVQKRKPFIYKTQGKRFYSMFVPVESVERFNLYKTEQQKPKEQYRPYSLKEFMKKFKVGDIITIREKNDEDDYRWRTVNITSAMFVGTQTEVSKDMPNYQYIILGAKMLSFYNLFNNYELYVNRQWVTFGVKI